MQGGDVVLQGRKALFTDLLRPSAFELGDDVARGAHLRASAVCGPDECRSPIVWIADTMDVSEALEIVYERCHGLWRDAGRSGELREPDPVVVEMLEDLGVGRSEIVETLLRQALEHRGGERFVGQAQRDPDMSPSVAYGQSA